MLTKRLKKLELIKRSKQLRPRVFFYYLEDGIEEMKAQNTEGLNPDIPVIEYHIPLTRQEAIETGLNVPERI